MIFEGKAVCDWPIDASGQATGVKTTYHGEEKCFSSATYLFGSDESDDENIPVGIHTYSFSCVLPSGIPYSSEGPREGQYAHVRYHVNANLKIHMGRDLNAKRVFKVMGIEDLNLYPELRIPCEVEENKRFCCWCCKSNPLIVRVSLPKAGFAVGEKIPINVEIDNKSSTEVTHTILALDQVYTLRCTSPRVKTNVIRETIFEMVSKGAKPGGSVNFEEQIQLAEDLVISNHRYSHVVEMNYELKVVAETSGISVSPEIYVPITIGAVALSQ